MLALSEVLWRYSQLCRIAGLVLAGVSAFLFSVMIVAIAQYGYVLVNKQPSTDLYAMLKVVGMPLLGTVLGLGLFFVSER